MPSTLLIAFPKGRLGDELVPLLAQTPLALDAAALARNNGGGYTAFAAWPFQSGHTPWEGKVPKPTDVEYLRTIAVARIFLDNFAHIQSSWVTMGRKTGQLALHYGCDDMGSLMLEENVVSAAGTCYSVNREEMNRMIRAAGYEPWQRDNVYGAIPV